MVKLYIVGNGFDLRHDLHTKYTDFRQFIKKKYPDKLINIEKTFGLDTDKQWNDLESALARNSIINIKE